MNKFVILFAVVIVLALNTETTVAYAEPLEGGVNPGRVQQIAAMLDNKPFAFGPKIEDRAGWSRLAATTSYRGVVKAAEKLMATPMPEMTEELYMLFKRTGRRTAEYGRARGQRYDRVSRFTQAECIENKGRFIKPLEAALRSICQEKTWIYNFHDGSLADYNGK